MWRGNHDYSNDPEHWKDPVDTDFGRFTFRKRKHGTYTYTMGSVELCMRTTERRGFPESDGWSARHSFISTNAEGDVGSPDLALYNLRRYLLEKLDIDLGLVVAEEANNVSK